MLNELSFEECNGDLKFKESVLKNVFFVSNLHYSLAYADSHFVYRIAILIITFRVSFFTLTFRPCFIHFLNDMPVLL